MPETVTLVDAMAYIFRSYYAQAARTGPAGQPTGASFGFLDFLLRLIVRESPSHLAVVFDSGPKSFRNALFPDYKANREAAPDDLLPQFAQCEALAGALGLPVFKVADHEADDVLASLAALCRDAGCAVRIISGDKDLAQLVDEQVSVHDPARNKRFTPRTVPKQFGVAPAQMVDYLALTGDASDNVPGVRGVGPKTAAALLQALGSLDGVYAALEQVPALPIRGARTLASRLAEQREAAYLSQRLVTLRRDLPLGVAPGDLAYAGAPRDRCTSLFAELGFEHLLAFVPRWQEAAERSS
jgi:DNA polymerase-1